jgi:streptogramin lyase
MKSLRRNFVLCCLFVLLALVTLPVTAQADTYTLDADFDLGTLVNVNHDAPNNDQLQLNWVTEPFPFINIACSARGTIVRIDTETGQILGEYRSAPNGRGRNPSRTTVDLYGNVWAGNRDEAAGGKGSVVKIGLVVGGTRTDANGVPDSNGQYLKPPFLYNTCIDRHGATIADPPDGLIKTSLGLGDYLPWTNAGGADNNGGVSTAEDEAILIYQRVNGDHVRHVSVDADNNVWTAGNFGADNRFDLLHGGTGAILASFDVGVGGYGGLVDGNKVIWSANRGPGPITVLRYDTKGTLTTADDTWSTLGNLISYGLGLDSSGNIWNSQWTWNQIRKFNAAGGLLGAWPSGGASNDRGVAVTPADDNVWVANSGGSDVSRLANNGALVKVIPLGADGRTPTGVAVDANGKVWVACLGSSTAKRIDPSGGGDGLGAVDLTVNLNAPGLANAGPYNYSDMTGAVLLGAIQQGTWTVIHDTGTAGTTGCIIYWNDEPEGAEPNGTGITVEARAADSIAGLPAEIFVPVTYGIDPGLIGQFIEIRATLWRDPGVDDTPVLSDLTVLCNQEPDCSEAEASISCLWPPNHKMVSVSILGVTDPDGDPVTIEITSITSDEATASELGAGGAKHAPDADGVRTDTASLRAERSGNSNGRVYVISFTATDGKGGECEGKVAVNVPHDQRPSRRSPAPCEAKNDGQNYDATDIN